MKREWSALAFAMVFPTLMTWVYFVVLASPIPLSPEGRLVRTPPNPLAQAAYGFGKVVQFSFPILFVWLVDRMSLRPRRPHFRGLSWAVGFGVLVGAGILGLYFGGLRSWLIRIGTATMIQGKIVEFNAATPLRYTGLGLFLAVAHSLLEEYYWRWFVFGRLRRLVPLSGAIVLSSLAFMAHHVIILGRFFPSDFRTAVVPFSLCIAVGGAYWAWLYHRSDSIYTPWLSHLLVDAAVMAVGYDLVFSI